jgi:excisionase family DNA binding protein
MSTLRNLLHVGLQLACSWRRFRRLREADGGHRADLTVARNPLSAPFCAGLPDEIWLVSRPAGLLRRRSAGLPYVDASESPSATVGAVANLQQDPSIERPQSCAALNFSGAVVDAASIRAIATEATERELSWFQSRPRLPSKPTATDEAHLMPPSATIPSNRRQLFFTSSQAARYLGVSLATIRRWTDAGHVSCYRTPGGQRRFAREQLDDFISSMHREGHSGPSNGDAAEERHADTSANLA